MLLSKDVIKMKIYVDHSRFTNGANKIDEYIGTINSYMISMNDEVSNMLSNWTGLDATTFDEKWKSLTDSSSTTKKMQNDLKNYAEVLRNIASKYQDAQITAVDEANSLPRWW